MMKSIRELLFTLTLPYNSTLYHFGLIGLKIGVYICFFFFAIVICQRERRINCTAIAPLFIKNNNNNNNNSGFGSLIFFFKNIILVTELPFALS